VKLLKEPLFHFLIVGTLLFAGYALLNRSTPTSQAEGAVRIGEGEIYWLRQTFTSQWQREPTPEEMNGLLATLVEEELLAREGRALGLDQNDTIVRRRLAQKVGFMVTDTTRVAEPREGELRNFYAAHAEHYRTAAKISFSHIYFSREHRRDAEADATEALRLVAGNVAERPAEGDRLLLDDSYTDLDLQAVEGLFGPDFAHAIFALPPGSWRGPVKSAFGVHLVNVRAVRPSSLKPFEEVREMVVLEWRHERDIATRTDYLAKLRAKYGVVIDDSARKVLVGAPIKQATP
jgi:hypothetical protein